MKANNAQSYPKKQKFKDAEGKEYLLTPTASTWADRNFHKVFMKNFQKTLKDVKSKELKVILWLMANMTPFNEVMATYEEIADGSETSYQTVARTIKALEKNNFLCRKGKGLLVNPDVVFRGRFESRAYVLDSYREARKGYDTVEPDEKTPESQNTELDSVERQLEEARENLKNLRAEKQNLKRKQTPKKKPGPKPKKKKEDGEGQMSDQKT